MQSLRYFAYICKHKFFVWQAGRVLRVGRWQLLIHDRSKFGHTEFGAYKRRFFAGKSGALDKERDPAEFHRAWTHHWHVNPHHWEHWLRMKDTGVVPMQMPERYVREMVADWCGAGRAIAGKFDAGNWYLRNHTRILLHPETRQLVHKLLVSAEFLLNGPQSKWMDLSSRLVQTQEPATYTEVPGV